VLSLWEEARERAPKGVRLGALARRVRDTGSGLAPTEEGRRGGVHCEAWLDAMGGEGQGDRNRVQARV
jgi:hypothetical protein